MATPMRVALVNRLNPDETVVEKRLSTREQGEPEAAAQLRQEAFLLGALGGRMTPRLVATGADAEGLWLHMERIAFPTLAGRLAQAGPAPLDRLWIARAARAAFTALADLHDAADEHGPLRIVHADLSPANLAVDDAAERAVILDLGLACWRESAPRDGAFRGTVGYCAPEIARGETPTVASDLFALAATLVHGATGVVPRDGSLLAAVLAVAAEQPLLDDPRVAGADLDRAILDCLAHDPAVRPSSARAVLARLAMC